MCVFPTTTSHTDGAFAFLSRPVCGPPSGSLSGQAELARHTVFLRHGESGWGIATQRGDSARRAHPVPREQSPAPRRWAETKASGRPLEAAGREATPGGIPANFFEGRREAGPAGRSEAGPAGVGGALRRCRGLQTRVSLSLDKREVGSKEMRRDLLE